MLTIHGLSHMRVYCSPQTWDYIPFVDNTLILIPNEGTPEKLHAFENSNQEKKVVV